MGDKHEEDSNCIDVERLVQSLIDLCDHLAKNIVAVFIIQVLSFVVSGLLLLRVVVQINPVKGILDVQVFQFSTKLVIGLLKICHKVTQPIDAVCRDIVGVTLTIVYLFLS